MKHYHLTPGDAGWELKERGSNRPVLSARTKEEAMRMALSYLSEREGSVAIHDREGRVREERTYQLSADPRRFEG